MIFKKNAYHEFIPLLFIIFIDTIGYFIVIPVVMRLFFSDADSLLASTTSHATRMLLYSLALMLSPLAFILCSPVIGYWSDRYGRKKALTYSLMMACIGFSLPIIGILTKTLSLIFVGRFISGASSSSQPVAQAAVTDFSIGKTRALYLSLIGFAMTLGMVIGPLSGSYLSDHTIVSWFNTTTPYAFAFILSIINIIMMMLLYKNKTQKKLDKAHWSLAPLFKHRIGLLMLSFFLLEISWSQYYQASFLTLTEHFHYAMNKMSLFAAYTGLWMCLGLTVIYSHLIRYMSIEKIAHLSLLVASASLLLCTLPSSTLQWILIVPASIAIGLGYPSLLAMISERTSSTHQGYLLGSASTLLGVAWMVTGLLSGPLSQLGFFMPTLVSGVAMLLAYLSNNSAMRRS